MIKLAAGLLCACALARLGIEARARLRNLWLNFFFRGLGEEVEGMEDRSFVDSEWNRDVLRIHDRTSFIHAGYPIQGECVFSLMISQKRQHQHQPINLEP